MKRLALLRASSALDRPGAAGRLLGQPLPQRYWFALGIAAMLAAVFWLLGLWHAAWLWPGQSDSAAVVLLGQDMRSGNWALTGWLLPLDTYWVTEIPLYAVAVSIRGIAFSLIHAVPFLIYLAVIMSGVWIARRGRRGLDGWTGSVVTLVLLGLLGTAAATTVLHGPAHISTALACLLAFAALKSADFKRPAGYLVAFVLLTLALTSDPMARVTGAAPVILVAGLVFLRYRVWKQPMAQALTVAAALGTSQVLRVAVQAAGGYTVTGGAPGLDGPSAWDDKFPLFVSSALRIFSADASVDGWLALVHMAVLGLVIAAAVAALWRMLAINADRESWLDAVLASAAAGTAAAFFLSGYVADETAIRYLSPSFIFASVLAGRTAVALFPGLRHPLTVPVGIAVLAVYAATFVGTATAPSPINPAAPLADWLLARGLTHGYGAYWDSNIVTVLSGNRVRVRPVLNGQNGLEPSHWNSTLGWYDVDPASPVTFVVFEPAAPWRGVDENSARATFGAPRETQTVDRYRILIWDHDLAPSLRPATATGKAIDEAPVFGWVFQKILGAETDD